MNDINLNEEITFIGETNKQSELAVPLEQDMVKEYKKNLLYDDDVSNDQIVNVVNEIETKIDNKLESTDQTDKPENSIMTDENQMEQVDISKYRVEKILSGYQLEPATLIMDVADGKDDKKRIGIMGFLCPVSRKFFLLTGEPINMIGFEEKLEEFIERKQENENNSVEEKT